MVIPQDYNMNKLSELKERYLSTEIPDNLDAAVDSAILVGRSLKPKRHSSARRMIQFAAGFAFIVTLSFVISVNTVPAFAEGIHDIPFLGSLARVFTFNEYDEVDEGNLIHVKIPVLENTGHTELEKRINREILMKMNEQIEIEKQAAREYKKAFLETGGKESEYWPTEITMDYEVKCNNNHFVSFVISKSISAAYFYQERYFYNFDLETGKEITLHNLLAEKYGQDYIEDVNQIIRKEIERRKQIENFMFFEGEDGFQTIDESTEFYINKKGNPVICFAKYEIAPGYMGSQEFEIER